MADAEEPQLIAGLRAGSGESLRSAYARHKQDILAVAAAVLGRGADGEAWDVLHDVFVGLARAAPRLRPDTNLRAYLTRAAANRARDRRGRGRAARGAGAAGAAEAAEAVASPGPGALERLERDEEVEALWEVLADLPDEQRVVVALRVWGDLTFREIAEQESISENTAQSRYRYALEKLRRHFHGLQGIER